jgi:hypothetical protein
MPAARRPLTRLAAAACLALLAARSVGAQQEPLPVAPATAQFMSRYDFRMTGTALTERDERFQWDTHWRGEFDLVDYVRGRLGFMADYQALLGKEFRPFDPYQSNYALAVSSSVRTGATEIAGVFHHVSRHLGDRARPRGDGSDEAVAVNTLIARVLRRVNLAHATVDVRADAGAAIDRAYVDYTWTAAGEVTVRGAMTPRLGAYGRGFGELIGVDAAVAGRKRQHGGRVEGGIRVYGARGDFELFAGYERVIDADPLDRTARHWGFAGFRLLNK